MDEKSDYKYPKTKKLIKKLQPYWKQMSELRQEFHNKIYTLENEMSKDLGIENMIFFMSDNEYCGIGNLNRNMELISDRELETGELNNYDE